MASVADKLDEARALIERGWARESYFSGARCYCASGAISKVTVGNPNEGDGDEFEQDLRFREVIAALGKAIDCHASYEVARWNDAQKSKKPVIDAFKRAAELARADAR